MAANVQTEPSSNASGFRPPLWVLVLAALATVALLIAILVNLTPLLRGPGRYPPEWRWEVRENSSLRGLATAIVCTLTLVAMLGASACNALRNRPRTAIAILLPLVIALSCGLQISLLAMEDGSSATGILVRRTMSPSFTSYYSVAMRMEKEHVPYFLKNFPSLLEQFPVHARTHPPGPILFFSEIKALMQDHPDCAATVVDAAGELSGDPMLQQKEQFHLHLAVALAGVGILIVLTNLACASVFLLTWAFGASLMQSLRVAIVWAFVPAFCLMIPQFDHILVLITTTFSALLATALRARRRPLRILFAGLAGLTGGLGLHISYGATIFLIFGAFVVCVAGWRHLRRSLLESLLISLVATAGGALVVFLPFSGYDLIRSAQAALDIHAKQFTTPRSYLIWLLFNPWDLAVFVGCPIAVVFVYRVFRSIRSVPADRNPANWIPLATTVALVILQLSGIVRGEVGRIWMPIMPFILISALLAPAGAGTDRGNGIEHATRGPSAGGAAILAILLFLCDVVLRYSWHVP